ncbi:hypothetical protein D0864_02927 [Hortaea werneckii]|uniref:Cytochrome b-c1 complex subunit 8 n=1 Tax=Hortaea werneckii TaxID=91943 RepID=A0A3M7GRV0_HORWE|nr:hypothetical protein D0864_02927 [Hortaea werneckii]
MRPSQILRAGGGEKKPGQYMGPWGAFGKSPSTTTTNTLHPLPPLHKLTTHPFHPSGSLPQKGIVTYGLAQNRQNPLAGTFNAAVFNTFRRTRHQILYWGLPLLIAYETMQWAIERNEYLNSKQGRAEFADEEE